MSTKNIKLMKRAKNGNEYVDFSSFIVPEIKNYFIMGHRGDGKTYGAIELANQAYWEEGIPSVYVRRLADSISKPELEDLMTPMESKIEEMSDGKFNSYDYRSKKFFPVFNEDGKISKRGKCVLYTSALNTWQSSKGADRGQIKYFIFDEAIDEKGYLKNEMKAYKNTMSTFVRDRTDTILLVLANPLNPYCPYFDHYGIEIEKMKQDTITDIVYPSGEVMRFVWLPESDNKKKKSKGILFAGKTQQSITTGAWDVGQYRIFDEEIISVCEKLYTIQVTFQRLVYKITAYYCNGYAPDGVIKVDGVILTITLDTECDDTDDIPEMQITDRSLPVKALCTEIFDCFPVDGFTDEILQCFKRNTVYYDSNTTGSAIEQWLKVVVANRGRVKA